MRKGVRQQPSSQPPSVEARAAQGEETISHLLEDWKVFLFTVESRAPLYNLLQLEQIPLTQFLPVHQLWWTLSRSKFWDTSPVSSWSELAS